MSSISSDTPRSGRDRRRLARSVRESLRDMSVQLTLLNHRVGTRLDLRDGDLGCLDLIDRHGPLSPGELARRAGLHPATVTGVLDRLERGGWIARDRHPSDRRGVLVRPVRERRGEILGLYAGMNAALDAICADYDEDQLGVVADFLRRTADAGRTAADDLVAD